MNRLITIAAGVVIAGALSATAFAQAAGPTGGGIQPNNQGTGQQRKAHAPIAKKFIKQLDLTADQQKQLKDLVEKYQQKHEELIKTGGKGSRKEAAAMHKQFLEDFGKILTPAQKDKLKALMEEARAKGKNGKGTPPPAGGSGGTGTGSGTGSGGGTTGGGG